MIKTFTKVPVTSYPHYNNGFYYVPDDYDSNPTKLYPTIIYFHGKGEAGLVGEAGLAKIFSNYLPKRIKDGWKPQATSPLTGKIEDFIVIVVQDQYWSPYPEAMGWAMKFFEGTEKLRIDKSRIYATGLSSGGQTSLMYGSWNPDSHLNVAAIASFSPAAIEARSKDNLPALAKSGVPVWFSSGASDAHFLGNQETYTKILRDNGGDVTTSSYTGAHCCWEQFYNGTTKVNYKGKAYSLYEWFLLFSKAPTPPREPKRYTITGTNNDFLASETDYIPGDTLVLKGQFKSIQLRNVKGTLDKPIVITNEGSVSIGNTQGYNGAAFSLHGCEYIEIKGTSKEEFIIDGSVHTNRATYFGLSISQLSSAVSVSDITIRNGGTGVLCKTSPTEDPLTWIDNPPLGPFLFRNMEIYGCVNEGMYIGDTSGYYDLTAKTQVYITPDQFDPTHKYVEQRLLKDVEVVNVFVHDIQMDAIQIAASIDVIVQGNEVTRWGLGKNYSHNGGILIGGKCRNTKVINNNVYDGWGNMLQYYASGKDGATHEVANNTFVGCQLEGVGVRVTDGAHLNFRDNVVAKTAGVSFRLYAGTATLSNVTLAEPNGGNITSDRVYIYVEPGVTPPTEINVKKLPKYNTTEEPECQECPPVPYPVSIQTITYVIMSDGTKHEIK